jgi:hypothetical protein
MAKPNFPTTRRYGEALAFDVPHQTADAAEDSRFLADVAKGLQDAEDETESREELKAKIRAEVIAELHEKLVVAPSKPLPPEQAQFVRNEGFNPFFEKLEEARRRRGH